VSEFAGSGAAVLDVPPARARVRRSGYGRYAASKFVGSLGSLGFMLVVSFFLFRVIPGDPARTLGRGRFSTPE